MSAGFHLNERDGSALFSDRLCSAAEHLFQRALTEDYIHKLLMKGETSEENKTRARIYLREVIYFQVSVGGVIKTLLQTATEEEKRFIEQMIAGFDGPMQKYLDKYQKIFGEAITGPRTMAIYLNHLCQVNNASNGFMHVMVGMYALYAFGSRLYDYVKLHPDYVTNDLTEMLTFVDVNPEQMIAGLRALIDKRAADMSEADREGLVDVFVRGIAMECIFYKSVYLGSKQYLYM